MGANTGTPRRRRRIAFVTAVSAGVIGLLVAAAPSSANLAGSTFEGNDGNMVVNTAGNTDWANVAGVNTGVDRPSGSTDNSFGQGTKEDSSAVTVVSGSIPPNKNDLTRFYEASQLAANNHNYLYLAWERLVNIGNANLDFEINQKTTAGFTGSSTGPVTLNRTAGDLLISYDFGGSGSPTLGLNFWLTAAAGNTVSQCFSANALPCWGRHITLSGGAAEGAVNTVAITDPLNGNASLGVGLFGEAAIDLTTAGVFPAGTCEAFGSTFVKSRSSSSFTAEIKDFIAPVPVNISNCGSITIHKVTENGDSSFGYTTTGGLTPSTFSLSNGGSQQYGAVPVGSYSVTENLTSAQQAASWTLKSLTCLPPTGSGTSVSISGATVSITLGANGAVDCTYTNHLKVQPAASTAQSLIPNDSFTLSGGFSPTGSITFSLFSPADASCSGTPALTETVTVNGNGTYSTSNTTFTATAEGTWRWASSYGGDSNNLSVTSSCGTEQFTISNH